MADLSGKRALVIGASDGADADLIQGIAAGLTESGARVQSAAGATAGRDLIHGLVDAGERLDVLVLGSGPAGSLAPAAAALMAQGRSGLIVCLDAADASGPTGAAALARELSVEVEPNGLAVLALRPATPGVTGRCVAALAMDPDIVEKAAGAFAVEELAREYRFTDPEAPANG